MSSGQAKAYDDAEEYEALCKKYNVKPQFSRYMSPYPYNIDEDHYYELKKLHQEARS